MDLFFSGKNNKNLYRFEVLSTNKFGITYLHRIVVFFCMFFTFARKNISLSEESSVCLLRHAGCWACEREVLVGLHECIRNENTGYYHISH